MESVNAMHRGTRTRRWAPMGILAVTLLNGCRTTNDDIHRWASTQQGPTKLVAVLVHDKYPIDLRVEAALTLVGMKARPGAKVGIDMLIDSLTGMPQTERRAVIAGLIPSLLSRVTAPPSNAPKTEADTSIPYKDAAFSLLTNEGTVLIEGPEEQGQLKQALIDWAMADFATRLNAPSQKVAMQQMLRGLGPDSVKRLPELIVPEAPAIDRICSIIAELGSKETKGKASSGLTAVAAEVASPAWIARKTPTLKQANQESGIQVDDKRFAQQLARYQEEELLRLFASMKQIGGKAAVEHLLKFAADKSQPETLRAGALAALEQNIDKNETQQVQAVLDIASANDTPDPVRDIALRRVGEMPRELVITRLYGLFENSNWKVRWLSAELALRTSQAKHIGEFMQHLTKASNMSISEPLRYGKLLGDLKGDPKPAQVIDGFAKPEHAAAVRVTALGYYYTWGLDADWAKLAPYAADLAKVPACAKDAKDCEWKCGDKPISTIGDFVNLCLKPEVKGRKSTAPSADAEAPALNASPEGAESQ